MKKQMQTPAIRVVATISKDMLMESGSVNTTPQNNVSGDAPTRRGVFDGDEE